MRAEGIDGEAALFAPPPILGFVKAELILPTNPADCFGAAGLDEGGVGILEATDVGGVVRGVALSLGVGVEKCGLRAA